MEWTQILTDLREVMTLQEIADRSGLKSKSTVHGIAHGSQTDVTYEVGVKLLAMHKKLMARKAAAAKKAGREPPPRRRPAPPSPPLTNPPTEITR